MIAEMLKASPLFAGLGQEVIDFFIENSHQRVYEKGSNLFTMGDPARCIFFVIDGWVKLYRLNRDGEEAIINIFAHGESFAEAAVFGPEQRYPVNAQAVERTTVLEIPRQLFVSKIRENSDLALTMLGTISARQRLLVQQIEQVTVKSAPQRIGTFLIRLCKPGQRKNVEIALPYDKSLIARRLNIEKETFSRALAKLKPYGVSVKGRQITIEDITTLADYCDLDERERPC